MDHFLPVVIAIVVLLVLGLIDELTTVAALSRRSRSTVEYQQRWSAFARDLGLGEGNDEDYVWLTRNQPRMSGELGSEGFIVYRAPYGVFTSSHYPILPNTLSLASRNRAHPDDFRMVDHILITHEGALATAIENARHELRNPVALLRRGLQFVLSLPLLLLSWSGLLSDAVVQRARQSVIFRMVQFLASIAVVLATVVTAISGWSGFVAQVQDWIGKPTHH